MHVRAIVREDLARVKEIDRSVFADHERYEDAVYGSMLESGRSVVAEDSSGIVVGYAFIHVNKPAANGEAFGYVRSIAVDRRFLRRGYARAMMEVVIAASTGAIDLFVDEANEPAVNLYRSFGFQLAQPLATVPNRRRMVLEL